MAAIWLAIPGFAQDLGTVPGAADVQKAFRSASVDWKPIPALMIKAFLAAEDRQFRERYPLRSTVTQTITLWYPSSGATQDRRKAVERAIADALTADEVAAWFVNGVFMGQGCYGARDAAEAYFGLPVEKLTLAQIAYLAVLPRGPARFHPIRKPDKALERRNFVLSEMLTAGDVTPSEARAATLAPLGTQQPLGVCLGK